MENNINFKKFYVKPKLPNNLKPLYELAENLWSTWDISAYALFNRIDPIIFRKNNHNAIKLLQKIPETKLMELSKNKGFLNELNSVYKKFNSYKNYSGYFKDKNLKKNIFAKNFQIAYFSMEYGLHESIPVYSGGLGILSGDHLKAASDLGLPLTGFGLLYQYGYFSQQIDMNGKQKEIYIKNKWYEKSIKKVTDKNNEDLILKINVRDDEISVKVWKINVGKVSLYLFDTNLEINKPLYRKVTDHLYDSDREIRILQEIVLAFASIKLLDYLKIEPSVFHMNEGHSAFIIIKRLENLIKNKGFSFLEARKLIRTNSVFTTHTPVPAGNEAFDLNLVKHYLEKDINAVGFDFYEFAKYAQVESGNNFSMSVLAIRFSKYINGVSKLHGEVSKEMWHPIYPKIIKEEMPIDYITNGVHIQTWVSRQITGLFDRYIGSDYIHNSDISKIWDNILSIPDIEIWEAHQSRKQQMITFLREKLKTSIMYKGNDITSSERLDNALSPDKLTIGFARRFATYKRANLILKDKKRLLEILNNKERPIQFIFAGKAHPADEFGKAMIKEIIDFAKENSLEDRFIFIEDYDINIARHLVQGVDVWLNNPIKPMEASGTSGMKAGMNGALNVSILDGWWPECYNKNNGWGITAGYGVEDEEVRDYLDSKEIYDILEFEVAKLYYNRDSYSIPHEWIRMMKHSIKDVTLNFNMHRMLRQYNEKYYLPIYNYVKEISNNNYEEIHKTQEKQDIIDSNWENLKFVDVKITINEFTTIRSGESIKVNVDLDTNNIPDEYFSVEIVHQTNKNTFESHPLKFVKHENNLSTYKGVFNISGAGEQSYNIKISVNDSIVEENLFYVKWYY